MKGFLIGSAFAVAVLAANTSAFAVSCTQQGGECRSWASGQGAQASMFTARCNAEVKTCISRCKAGNKVFIGVSSSPQQYPITECK
jgi:hypothetical protein